LEAPHTPSFLIVRLGALGDIVHGLPALAALRASFPDARIDWLVDRRHLAMLELVPALTGRLSIDTRRWSGQSGLGRVVKALRRARYQVAIDLQGLIKSAVLARLSGAVRIIGFDRAQAREGWAAACYTETVDPGRRTHVVDRGLALAEAAGGRRPATAEFPLRIPASAAPDAVRRALGLGASDGFSALNPGAAWPNKRWPPERFGALAATIYLRWGLRSIVLWGPGEEALAGAVSHASDGAALPAPSTTLADLAAVLRAARLVVAGDTGPLHLAAALGTPVVGLFGPTDPARNGPWAPADVTVSRSARCRCSHERRCTAAEWCLDDVAVAEVVEAVARRLADS
jgi:lipopolysaccharide heptosyltransferase I